MSKSKLYEERRVLQLLAQGSEYAFAQLFDRYRAKIFSVAFRFFKSQELAEEAVQEVFMKLWIKREDLPKILHFEGYLFAMARNHVFDVIKELAEEATALQEFSHRARYAEGADQPLLEQQYEALLQEIVEHLPPQQKQIFRLAKIEGLSHQAIADRLKISRLTVKTHMAKALQSIRLGLQHHLTTFTFLPIFFQIFDQ